MKKFFIAILTIILIFSTNSLGANWASNGYEWAKNKGFVPANAYSYLSETVSPDDFYSAVFKITSIKKIRVSINQKFWKMEDYASDNYILVSMDKQLTQLAQKEWITNSEYKRADTLIKNARNILAKNDKYFEKNEKTSIEFYLEYMNYILYEKIYDYTFKQQLSVGKPKYGDEFIEYKLIPYYGEITREEYLNLMYYFLYSKMDDTITSSKTITFFKTKNILLGYNNNLMLNVKLTYAHMSVFMQRMY